MATNKEEIIIDVQINIGDVEKKLGDVTKQMSDLKNQNAETRKQMKSGEVDWVSGSKLIAENNNQIKLLTATEKQLSGQLAIATADNRKYGDSNVELRAQVLDLERQYNSLSKEQKNTEGGKAMLKLQNELKDKVKENSEQLGNFQGNVGNYGKALDAVAPSLKGTITGFLDMGKALWALVANPIGAVIAAISAVFLVLYSVLKNFDPVLDKIEQSFAAVGSALSVLKESVLAVITGQRSLSDAISNTGNEMSKAANEAINLKKAQQDLDDKQKETIVNQEKYKNQISELILQSKNRTLSEKERIALIDRALQLEEDAFKERKKNADEEVRIAQESIINDHKLTAFQASELKKRGVAYLNWLKDRKQISDEERQILIDALVKQESIEGESISLREKALNRRDQLEQAAADKAEKRRVLAEQAAEKKRQADERAAQQAEKDAAKKLADAEKLANKEIAILQANLKSYLDANEIKLASDLLTSKQRHAIELDNLKNQRDELLEEQNKKLIANKDYLEQYNAITTQITDDYNKNVQLKNIEYEKAEKQRKIDVKLADLQNAYEAEQANSDRQFELKQQQLDLQQQIELEAAEKIGASKTAIEEKYAKLSLDLERSKTDSMLSMEQSLANSISTIAGKQTQLGKLAAAAAIAIDTYKGAMAAYASFASMGPVGIVAGVAAAAAVGVQGANNIRKVMSVEEPKGEKFATGGIVPGINYTGDKVPALVNSGEMILNQDQQARLFAMVAGGGMVGGGGIDYMALANAMSKQPAPVLNYAEFTQFQQKIVTFDEITKI